MAHRSYKFRLYPTIDQVAKLDRSLWLLREFYNAALQERRDAWTLSRVRISGFDQIRQIPDIRAMNDDYLFVTFRMMTQTIRKLDRSFNQFYRRAKEGKHAGFPRFKGRAYFNSIIYNNVGFRLKASRLKLSAIGEVKIRLSRPIEGTIKEVIAKREGSKWYAVISCDEVPTRPLEPTRQSVGIDVGIESFATLSDGTQIDNWRYYESAQKKLRVAARRVARRKKGSNRRQKAVDQLRAIHQKIFNRRHDFQHKLSTHLIQNFDLIAVEKLNIKGMSRGILSKQVTDASWGSFIQKLTYKAASAGRRLIEVAPHYTSQDCSDCGTRVKKSLAVRVHNCEFCGLSIHRDWNAALNILSLGLSDQALTCPVAESVA